MVTTVKVGMEVCTEFGTGEVLAITSQWLIQKIKDDDQEVAISLIDDAVWLPLKFEIGGGKNEVKIDT